MALAPVAPIASAALGRDDEYFIEMDCDDDAAAGRVALADTSFHLYLYDRASLRLLVHAARAHAERIRAVRLRALAHGPAAALLSASDDGRVRVWDPAQGLHRPALELAAPDVPAPAADDEREGGHELLALDVDGSGTVVAAGGEARVLLWDVRAPQRVLRAYTEVHTEACTSVAFHGGDRRALLSGSVDGLLCVLDTEREPSDDELVRSVCNPGDAVVRAGSFDGWPPAHTSAHAYCVSGTEVVSAWDLSSGLRRAEWANLSRSALQLLAEAEEPGAGAPRAHGPAADYIVDCVHDARASAPLVIVAGTHGGELRLLAGGAAGGEARALGRLGLGGAEPANGHGASVRACAWVPAAARLLTAAEDGRLCCWRGDELLAEPPGAEEAAEAAEGAEGAPAARATGAADAGRAERAAEHHADAEADADVEHAGRRRAAGARQLPTARQRAARSALRASARGPKLSRAAALALLAECRPAHVRAVTHERYGARTHWLGRVRALATRHRRRADALFDGL